MKKLLLTLALIAPIVQAEPSMPPDNTGGRKAHIQLSAALGLGASLLVNEERSLKLGPCGVTCQRFALALTPGLLKEIRDYQKGQAGYQHGLFSRKDLQADALGAAMGVLSYSLVEGLLIKPGKTTQVAYVAQF